MPISFDFRIAIFDLDLTMFDGKKLYTDVVSILHHLKSNGVKLYVASFHLDAENCCKELSIADYFEEIHYGRDRSKADMIMSIIKKNRIITHHDVVFFDDNFENIRDVKMRTNVRAIHIDDFGLSWINVPLKFKSEQYTAINDLCTVYDIFDEFEMNDISYSGKSNSSDKIDYRDIFEY
jgi:FMN phosphatase YigB (HAD superfamily)